MLMTYSECNYDLNKNATQKSYILTPVLPCNQLEKGGNFFPNSAYLKKKQDLQMSKSEDISQNF